MIIPRIISNSRKGETKTYVGTPAQEQFEGGSGTDIFRGMGGADTFRGGYGLTIVDYSWAPAAIRVNLSIDAYQNTGGAGLNRLVAIRGIIGSRFDDDIWGHNNADTLRGEGGNDTIHGSLGNDLIDGGLGNDNLDGGDGADSITGGAGDDRIDGGWDNDTIDGGDGNDSISDKSGADTIRGGGGNDVITAGANDDKLYGDAGDDRIDGGPGSDLISGGAGFDTASYGSSARAITIDLLDPTGNRNTNDATRDTYSLIESFELSNWNDIFLASNYAAEAHGGAGDDQLTGRAGKDRLFGDGGDDRIDGGAENDILVGGEGRDTLIGGTGIDNLYGGGGADKFVFQSENDSVRPNPDTIVDFFRSQGDKIDLSAIDAVRGGGNNAFTFLGLSAFTGVAGQLYVRPGTSAGIWEVLGDVNGDKVADFFLHIVTTQQPIASDFIL